MKARSIGHGLVAGLVRRLVMKLESVGLVRRFVKKAYRVEMPENQAGARQNETRYEAPPVEHADEKTIRLIATAQDGGISSEESRLRYERGENPGGTHHKAVHRDEGPLHLRPQYEEPQGSKERIPGKEKHMSELRKGKS